MSKPKHGKIVFRKSRNKKVRVRIVGANGEVLQNSEQLSHVQDAKRNIEAVMKVLSDPGTQVIDEVTPKKKK